MTPDSFDTGRELSALPQPRVAGPILLSIVLHTIVVLAFARAVFSPAAQDSVSEDRPSISVTIAMRAPPPAMEPPAPEDATDVPLESVEATEDVIEDVAEEAPAEPEVTADLQLADSPSSVAPASPEESVSPDTASTESDTDAQPWTPARIRAAIQASSGELRSSVTETWMADCIRERKMRGTRDCEQQLQQQDSLSLNAAAGRFAAIGAFASVTRGDRQWRLAEGFKKSNDTLRELVDADGLVGELATARYYLNRDYIIYLSGNRVNGNHNDMVFHAMQNFAADELGGPNLTLNGDTPFQCGSKKKIEYGADLKTQRVTAGNVVPCIYEYTGFTIERPEEDPDAFRVVPPVFGTRR